MSTESNELRAEIRQLNHQLEDQAREIERLKTLSDTDPLTGIANRRRFDEELNRRVAEFHRLDRGFCLIIIDIDRFKDINDRLGHVTGDRVLRTLAQSIRQQIRTTDFIARLGGDEFAMILPGIDESAADAIIRRSRQVSGQKLEDLLDNGKASVRWSAGICAMNDDLTREQLLDAADAAMFDDKRSAASETAVSGDDKKIS